MNGSKLLLFSLCAVVNAILHVAAYPFPYIISAIL